MLCCRYLTLWMKYVRFAHSSIGYIVIFYSQYVILSGLYAFQVSTRNLYFIQIIAIILCFLIIEIAFCLINKKYYKAFVKINKKNLKTMSLKAFNESNKKLAFFNDYVVDLTSYAYEHPGGTFVIQQCNKKDIGKYIYGAYSMEDNVSPHKHSFIAMKIVERLICARIVPERQFDNEIESRRSVARFEDSQQFIEASICNIKRSSCYKVGKCVNFQYNLYRVVFEDTIDSDHYIFREGLGFIGKHYVVISEKNQVARYYTICQTFHSKVYKQYLDAFDNVLTGKKFERKFETIEQISNETSNSIELFMKFYTQSKNGITKQISSAAQEDRFIVSGIFGKGLNLEKQNIVGSNLIVVGGTGILPFIDLFAYLARRLISKKAEMSQVFFREVFESYIGEAKFLIFAFYPDKSTAVGVEFCEKISQLFLHFGLKHNFKFLPRYTRNGDPKISNEDDVLIFIEEVLAKTKIKNIFVCGPPSMNNAFQQATIKICSQFKFEPNQIEII